MKLLIVIFMVFLSATSGVAQEYQKLDSISDYDGQQTKFIYDENGINVAKIFYNWDSNSMNFLPTSKNEYTYNHDSVGNCILINSSTYSYNKNEKTWNFISKKKEEMSFDEKNNIKQSHSYVWEDNSWILTKRVDHENFYSDNLLSITKYHTYTNQGYHLYSCTFEYDSNNEIKIITYRDFDPKTGNNITENYKRYAIINDSNNNITAVIKYKWKSFGGQWQEETKIENVFNNEFDSESLFFDIYYSSIVLPSPLNIWLRHLIKVKHMITVQKYYYYSLSSFSWRLENEFIYHYKPMTITLNNEMENRETILYPNPAKNYFNIVMNNFSNPTEIEILNLNGKKLLTKEIQENTQILTDDFSSGFYFVRILKQDKSEVYKIFINK